MDKKYLHSFKDRNEYDKYIQTGYTRPFASATYVGKGDPEDEIRGHRIDFNLKDSEKYDLEKKTNLTFKVTNPGTLYWVGLNTSSETEALSYRKNFGEWFTVQRGIVTNCSEGDIIEFKASMSDNHMVFSGDSNLSYTVYGNVMSLQYPESFAEQSAMTGTFYKLFSNCVGLHNDDMRELVLPAMGLVDGAYESMFEGCTSLVVAPKLPAKTLSVACYKSMFKDCESLSNAPQLPSNTIPDSAYHSMFMNCTSLVTAPDMTSDNKVRFITDDEDLMGRNLRQMFKGCTSLVNGPSEIPTVYMTSENAYYVYEEMFMGCSSLRTAPDIMNKSNFIYSADREVFKCMFKDCTSLNYIHAEFEGVYYTGSTANWVNNVSGSGLFVKSTNAHWKVRGDNGVPLNWDIENEPVEYREECLTFNILSSGTINWLADSDSNTKGISYSLNNGQSWTEIYSSTEGVTISVSKGDKIMFKGDNARYSDNSGRANTFSGTTAIFEAEGNILSLVNSTGFTGITELASAYTFEKLFVGCTGLTTAENLVIEAEVLSKGCYDSMFSGCTLLATPPILLSETLAELCYYNMFWGCTNLSSTPVLPATTLATNCYAGMFHGCTSLTATTELPSTTLANGCYNNMFNGCTGITSAPVLQALTLVENCYASMFNGCTSLNYIKCLATDISAENCTSNWVYNVANSGTFVKDDEMEDWAIDNISGIPIGWTLCGENQILPLTFEITSGGVISWKTTSNDTVKTIWYSTNNGSSWTQLISTLEGSTFEVERGDIVLFKGDNDCYGKPESHEEYSSFSGTTAGFNVKGNIMSLLDSTGFSASTTLSSGSTFLCLFYHCENLVDAGKLQLPAMTLARNCYHGLFNGCYSLTAAPKLPATIMEVYCYAGMFYDCRSLVTAPALPSTNLSYYCYGSMFAQCSNLTNAPELPAQITSAYCYNGMFYRCQSLVNPPIIHATNIDQEVCRMMFYECTSLTHPAVLSAVTGISTYAYAEMYYGCTSLITAPELPLTTLATFCYSNMFEGCTGLTTPPVLSAETLAVSCYSGMFKGCTSLSGAPELPATTLVENCYMDMFQGCTNLEYIKCLATDITATDCTKNWVSGVAETGTFNKESHMSGWTIDSVNGVPVGWTLIDNVIPYSERYLTFEILSSGTINLKSSGGTNTGKTIEYSLDNGVTWTQISFAKTTNGNTISVEAGDVLLFRGNNECYGNDSVETKADANGFRRSTAKFKVSGNIMSLVNSDKNVFPTLSAVTTHAFSYMFEKCSGITDASNLVFPAVTLGDYSYRNMFSNCPNLVNGPKELPATTLGKSCYRGMFSNDSSLSSAINILPATNLKEKCYSYMYEKCTSITTAPVLPDATLATEACIYMFTGCTNLNYIKCFWSSPSTSVTNTWVANVANSGTFVYNKNIQLSAWVMGNNGIPTNWIAEVEQIEDYLKMTVSSAGNLLWKTNTTSAAKTISYSKDEGDTWTEITSTTAGTPISVSVGDVVYFKGDNTSYGDSSFNYNSFEGSTAGFTLGGNILSLVDSEEFDALTEITSPYVFYRMFADCTGLTSASELKLTAETISNYCYHELFEGCTNLTSAPQLPAATLSNYCYYAMFDGCTSLNTTPELAAGTLVEGCYKDMFKNCSSLNNIRCYATSISATDCTSNWVYNVSGSGTFVRDFDMSGWTVDSVNGIPVGWTDVDNLLYQPLTFDILTGGTIYWKKMSSSSPSKTIQYSKDNGATWTSITTNSNGVAINVNAGDKMLFKGNNQTYGDVNESSNSNSFSSSTGTKFNVRGNIMSLINSQTYSELNTLYSGFTFDSLFYYCAGVVSADGLLLPATTLASYSYYCMFVGCTSLITAPELPATTLTYECYGLMFADCTSLTSAPELPATTLTDWCYYRMFYGCTSLTTAPELPATTLAYECYGLMFADCTSLTSAPELPATTLTDWCYYRMFYGCTSLTTAPELPATTLASNCYYQMFMGCTLLTIAPELPVTTLASNCYGYMFYNCTSLTTAPELPATTLAYACYEQMFYGCTSLTTAPELQATTLAQSCYSGMFHGCTSLTTAPELPATTLASYCYYQMFNGCTSLTTAPELPATTLANNCYYYMFRGCTNLNYIKCLATNISASNCTYNWVSNVSGSGIFVKADNMSGWTINSVNGIPSGWTTMTESEYERELLKATPLTFEIISGGTIYWMADDDSPEYAKIIQYSKDNGTTWTTITASTDYDVEITVNAGDKVMFRGDNATYGVPEDECEGSYFDYRFDEPLFNVKGNIMSMIDSQNYQSLTTLSSAYTFYRFFVPSSYSIISARNLILPATTLTDCCYKEMFKDCELLTDAPELPASSLTLNCYEEMFRGCTSLTTAPELLATELNYDCYYSMFRDCTSLTTPPSVIPAENLSAVSRTCMYMFANCTSLTYGPDLPATELETNSYSFMFAGCTSLTEAPELPATTLGSSCYSSMFSGCTSLTTAPVLPATDLDATYCYYEMFADCTSLNYIKCFATGITSVGCTNNWVKNVASAGRFVKADDMSGWTVDSVNGIPSGWTVVERSKEYLTFIAQEDGTFKFNGTTTANTLSYSLDNGNTWTALANNTNTPTVASGSRIMWKGNTTPVGYNGIGVFASTGNYEVEGNVMSLTHGDDFATATTAQNYEFLKLFYYSTKLTSAENLVLPATTLAEDCYGSMFQGCTSLTTAPALPATTLEYYCCNSMFQGCTNLTTAPELPATTLAEYCYSNMFHSCTSLTQAPELPATTLASECYNQMFSGCTSLTQAPELPATTLSPYCYRDMFRGCTSLTTAPELPATSLRGAGYCYHRMFYGCTSLNYIKCLAIDISASYCTTNWVYGVAATGTFVKDPNMSGWTTGVDGIPTGWTIEDAT